MLSAVIVLTLLASLIGLGLSYAAARFRADPDSITEHINALLPQTQCGQCRYPGCRPYAQAIAQGHADVNQCPPGGEATIRALADLLNLDPKPLHQGYGSTAPPQQAVIDESTCIGCALCLQACPVDAIVGAPKQMHTVMAQACTGCELCLPPCPVDCIELEPVLPTPATWQQPYPQYCS